MEVVYQIVWDTEALQHFKLIFYWYKTNRSTKAANKFRESIEKTLTLMQRNPFMGECDKYLAHRSKEYRSFLSFPHHRIVYFIADTTIYITAVRDNRMEIKPNTN